VDLHLDGNTLVIFTSDNGSVCAHKPLRGCKGMLYEGGIRVPTCARWPGRIKPGSVCDTPVANIDFYPTFLDAGGSARPRDYVLDGESILPLLTNSGELKRQELFWFFPCYLRSTTPCAAVRQGDWKLLLFFENPDKPELYNLKNDMKEEKNVAASQSAKCKELHAVLKDWLKRVEAPVPLPLK